VGIHRRARIHHLHAGLHRSAPNGHRCSREQNVRHHRNSELTVRRRRNSEPGVRCSRRDCRHKGLRRKSAA
jgi:hypothetical protein